MPEMLNNEKLNLIAVFLLLIVSLLVSFKRNDRSSSGFFLVAYFWTFFYSMLLTYLVDFRYVALVPHLFRTGFPVTLLIMPASYLYIRQSLVERRLRWPDLLHLLPFMIFVVDHLHFYFLSAEQKLSYINALPQQELMVGLSQGSFMPTYGYTWLRYGQMIVYSICQLYLIYRASKIATGKFKEDFLTWLRFLTSTEILIFSIPIIAVAVEGLGFLGPTSTISESLLVVAQGLFLLFRPEILYGLGTEQKEFEENATPKEEHYSDEALIAAGETIEAFMTSQKPYLNHKFRIQDLSFTTGLSVHKISAYVNRIKHLNYFSYVNHFRINDCLAKLDSGEHDTKTLEAIADECGFHSRTTFIRVFKQVTGKTPSEYITSIR